MGRGLAEEGAVHVAGAVTDGTEMSARSTLHVWKTSAGTVATTTGHRITSPPPQTSCLPLFKWPQMNASSSILLLLDGLLWDGLFTLNDGGTQGHSFLCFVVLA